MTNLSKIILAILFVFNLCGCGITAAEDEKLFKGNAKQLDDMINELNNVEVERKPVFDSTGKQVGISISTKKQEEFIDKKEKEWIKIKEDFESIGEEYPNSVWNDDAVFLIALEYKVISKPGRAYKSEAIDSYQKIVENYDDISLEQWTKQNFKDNQLMEILFAPIDKSSPNVLMRYEPSIRMREFFRQAIIMELLNDNDIAGAEKVYEEMKEENVPSDIQKITRDYIDAYLKATNKMSK